MYRDACETMVATADDYAEVNAIREGEELVLQTECDCAFHEGLNDGGKDFGTFGPNYQPHQYEDMTVRIEYIRGYIRGRTATN
jgi:hypothetical protein